MLTTQNIEAELSYAYLHAVASKAAFGCEYTTRHMDGAGVDAIIRADGRPLAEDATLSSFAVNVQLKATVRDLPEVDERFSYSLPVAQYNKLRRVKVESARLLVLLRLPPSPDDWLRCSEDGLVAKRCAYWVSLRNAPESANASYQTIYIPRSQLLSPESLTELMARLSRQEKIEYAP